MSRIWADVLPICCSWASPSGSWFHPFLCLTWMIWTSWGTTSESCSTSMRGWPPPRLSSWFWVRLSSVMKKGEGLFLVHILTGTFLLRLLRVPLQYFRTNQRSRLLRRRFKPNASCLTGARTLLLCWGCCATGPSCSWCSAMVGSFQSLFAPKNIKLPFETSPTEEKKNTEWSWLTWWKHVVIKSLPLCSTGINVGSLYTISTLLNRMIIRYYPVCSAIAACV